MQFTLRSLFLFTAGVAAVASAASTLGSMAGLMAMVLFLSAVGAYSSRTRYWRSCLFGGLGGVVALWFALLLHAFILPWSATLGGDDERTWEAYQQFVRDTLVAQLLYLAVEGLLLGFLVATLVWAIRRVVMRPG